MRHLEDYGPQQSGECVLRSRDLNEWFFWDGSGFTKQFEDPYTTKKTPEERVCKTLDNHFGRIRSVVYSSVYHVFITVVPSGNGIGYATSSDLKNWSEELSILCDAPEKLARRLFDEGMLLGFDLDSDSGYLNLRVKDARTFYSRWTGLLLESGVKVQAIRSQSRSLKNIFDKVTT